MGTTTVDHNSGKILFLLPMLVSILIFIIVPLIRLGTLIWDAGGLPANLVKLFEDEFFWLSMKTTLIFVVATVGIELVLGTTIALLVQDVESSIIRAIFLLPMLVAPISTGLVWRLMFQPIFGIINTTLLALGLPALGWLADPAMALPSIILVDVWQWTPFIYLVMLSGLKSLPQEPFEAARIDGASTFATIRYITLPQLKPVIFVAVLFRTLDAIKAFDKFVTLTGGGPGRATEVLAMHIYKVTWRFFEINYGALLAVIPIFVLIIFERSFTSLLRRDEGT